MKRAVPGGRNFSMQALVAGAMVSFTLLIGGVFIWQSYQAMQRVLVSAVADYAQMLGQLFNQQSQHILEPTQRVLRLLVHDPLAETRDWQERLERLPVLAEGLRANDVISAAYVGYPNGEFLLIRPLEREGVSRDFAAPPGARYLLQIVRRPDASQLEGEWWFLGAQLNVLQREARAEYRYDPRTRPWFQAGIEPTLSRPYRFFTTTEAGMTLSQRNPQSQAVVGMDVSTHDLARSMGQMQLTPNTELVVIDANGDVIAHPDFDNRALPATPGTALPALPGLDELTAPDLRSQYPGWNANHLTRYTANGQEWFGLKLPLAQVAGQPLTLLVALPVHELLANARHEVKRQLLWLLGLLPLAVLLGLLAGRRLVAPLRTLAAQVRHLANFNFSFSQPVSAASRVREIRELTEVIDRMTHTIRNLQLITHTLHRGENLESLLEDVLNSLIEVAGVRSGSIYLHLGGDHPLTLAAASGSTHYPLHYHLDPFSATAAPNPDNAAQISMPLRNRRQEPLGVLVVEPEPASVATPAQRQSFMAFLQALSASAALAIETRQLINNQYRLFDAIIRLLANAVDAKSPYTGGHCERVPQLAQALLDQAIAETAGPFAQFSLNASEREAFRIGAWLHDCGKLTSPDYLMDKATKLETVYNRIHEIRSRFEILWRDAETACWQAIAQGANAGEQQQTLAAAQTRLREQFAFIAHANIGGESMSDTDIARVHAIGQQTWWRHFDDRLGLSRAEENTLSHLPKPPLPVQETLLADKPEHLGAWGDRRPPVSPDDPANRWGFKMALPEHPWNHGELHNLCIKRGTLNAAERFKVNEHIVQTIIMLDSLPLPDNLKRVPAIAGNHHEKLDGTGFPRQLTAESLSIPERIMVIADIFEALTAADRPYKPAKTLSESLTLLAGMARSGHVDPALFELFVRSGVYRTYAARFLLPEQRDAVDEAALLEGIHTA